MPSTAHSAVFIPPELWLQIFNHLDYATLKFVLPLVSRWISRLLLPGKNLVPTPLDLALFRDRTPHPLFLTSLARHFTLHPLLARRFTATAEKIDQRPTSTQQPLVRSCDFMYSIHLEPLVAHPIQFLPPQESYSDPIGVPVHPDAESLMVPLLEAWRWYDNNVMCENAMSPAVAQIPVHLATHNGHRYYYNAKISLSSVNGPLAVRDFLLEEVKFCASWLQTTSMRTGRVVKLNRWKLKRCEEMQRLLEERIGTLIPRSSLTSRESLTNLIEDTKLKVSLGEDAMAMMDKLRIAFRELEEKHQLWAARRQIIPYS